MRPRADEFLDAIAAAERAAAAAGTLRADHGLPTLDAMFGGHLVARHGLAVDDLARRPMAEWREAHRSMPHADHGHGWRP